MQDRFGREIINNGDGTYACEGLTVAQGSDDAAIKTFNGMAPPGWTDPDAQ